MFFVFLFIIIIYSIKNKCQVLGLFLILLLLVPFEAQIYPIRVSFLLLTSFLLVLFSFIVQPDSLGFYKCIYPPLIFCIYYALIRIVWAFLGTHFRASDILTISFFNVFVFVFAIVFVWKLTDFVSVKMANRMILYVLLVVSLYGFVAYIYKRSFYIEFLSFFSPNLDVLASISQRYSEEARGAISSRLSGVTFSPLQYAITLNAYIYLLFYNICLKSNKNKLFLYFVVGLVFLNILMTGSRGPIVALLFPLFICSFLYLNASGKVKLLLCVGCCLMVVLLVPFFNSYASFVKSFIFIFDETYSQNADISGSSVSGRTMQMEAAFEILTSLDLKTILFGYGDGYHLFYAKELGENKSITGEFEGILMSATLNYGILGFLFIEIVPWIFICFLISYFRNIRYLSKVDSYILYSMFLTDVITCFLVGQCARILYYTIFFYLFKQMVETNKLKVVLLKGVIKGN